MARGLVLSIVKKSCKKIVARSTIGVRSMSKTQICDVVVKCFKKFDKDIVMLLKKDIQGSKNKKAFVLTNI